MTDDRCQSHQSPPARVGRKRRQSEHGGHKRGPNSKIHLAVDAHGMSVRMLITAGITADCSQASTLIEGLDAQHLLVDKDYNSNAIVAEAGNMTVVMPPRRNRNQTREYDRDLYRLRHLVENAFLHLNRW